MSGHGPFLWVNEYAPAAGFHRVPPGGMCLSVFLFVKRGAQVLLGKYQEHPSWEPLTGMDAERVRRDSNGWTIPARPLRLGEDPRDAARHIAEQVLEVDGLEFSEPRVEVEFWRLGEEASGPAARRALFHYDIWFFVDAEETRRHDLAVPTRYSEMAWHSPEDLPAGAWAAMHEDVAARWMQRRPSR